MHRVRFHYTIGDGAGGADDGGLVRNPLFDLLHAVVLNGSISGAARAVGLSYRHVWGELKRLEEGLGQPLIVWEKGQAARLTDFAAKLLWAERQAQARLAPQVDALRAELERAFAIAFDPDAHVLNLFASHDEGLAALREHARGPAHRLHLDIRFTGSVDAIRALNEGRCQLAGFHTLHAPAMGSLAQRTYRPLLRPGRHKIIGFAQRGQGLMVARGNPLELRTLADVARTGAVFANRALGSGTRLLFDELLTRDGLDARAIRGYERAEPSHAAVAQAVAAGEADAALGIEACARGRGLDFVPLAEERYHLVCLKAALQEPATAALLGVLRESAWQERLAALPGYRPAQCGEVLAMRRVLPWWRYRSEKG